MNKIVIFFFFIIFSFSGYSQNLYFPAHREGVSQKDFDYYTKLLGIVYSDIEKYKAYKTSQMISHVLLSKCYYYLKEDVDSVFHHLDIAFEYDSEKVCSMLKIMMQKEPVPFYFIELDSVRFYQKYASCLALEAINNKEYIKLKHDPQLGSMIKVLDVVLEQDQKYREQISDLTKKCGRELNSVDSLWLLQHHLDSLNLVKVDKIINVKGLLGKSLGKKHQNTMFFVLLHLDEGIKQEKYLPYIIEAYKKGEILKGDLVWYYDRMWTNKTGKQIFGLSTIWDSEKKKYVKAPFEDQAVIDRVLKELELNH